MAASSPLQMPYRRLGNTGLKVSAISLGAVLLDSDPQYEQHFEEIMDTALAAGINFYDNAEAYCNGRAESVMGNIFKKWFSTGKTSRMSIVVSTKVYWGTANQVGQSFGGVNTMGLSRKRIIEGCHASLARLQLDYVDIFFCHRPDPQCPTEEIVRAMNFLLNQGKIFYWGTSEWSAAQIMDAHAVAGRLGLVGPLAEQPQYNLLHRTRVEREYAPLYANYGMGTTIWSPLAMGLLTGKYSASGKYPVGSRLADEANVLLQMMRKQFEEGEGLNGMEEKNASEVFRKVDALGPIVERLGCTRAQLALAWCLLNPHVSTVITGASNARQITDNMACLEVFTRLTPEVVAEIEVVLANKPGPPKTYY